MLSKNAISALVALVCALSLFSPSTAFDTGPHNDITRNVLELLSYSRDAQALAATTNWFTDVYAFSPSIGNKVSVLPNHIPDLEMMHCNNLYSITHGANYIAQHLLNTRAAVEEVVRRGDVVGFLAVMGTSVHTYQDFYAHSNWAELNPRWDCDCYHNGGTFFSKILASNVNGSVDRLIDQHPALAGWNTYEWRDRNYPNFNVFGGIVEHGEYCAGINKDSYVRPHYEETYAFAFAATMEWLYNIEKWAEAVDSNRAVLNAAKGWTATGKDHDGLYQNFNNAFEVSYSTTAWVFGQDDGHWKGEGTGSVRTFVASVTDFSKSNTTYTQYYLRSDNPIYKLITNPSPYTFLTDSLDPSTGDVVGNDTLINLATRNFTPFDQLPAQFQNLTAVVVRTTQFSVSDAFTSLFSNPDPWALVSIGGLEIKEAPMKNKKSFTPYWTAIKFVPINTTTVDISYKLIDAEATKSMGSQIPITNNNGGTLNLQFDASNNTLATDSGVRGVYNTSTNVLKVSNDSNSVSLYVDTRNLQCAGSRGNKPYIAICGNTAFGELGTYTGCDGSKLAKGVEMSGGESRRGWVVSGGMYMFLGWVMIAGAATGWM
ncbi:hypothetical protein HK104_009089 [Borealophlyctis nickersoniae]|nr:hypothetical protein HK104_009089 [Borealophlyctis nickersoniae]